MTSRSARSLPRRLGVAAVLADTLGDAPARRVGITVADATDSSSTPPRWPSEAGSPLREPFDSDTAWTAAPEAADGTALVAHST